MEDCGEGASSSQPSGLRACDVRMLFIRFQTPKEKTSKKGSYLQEVRELRIPRRDHPVDLVLQLPFLLVIERRIVLGQPRLSLPILQQNEAYLGTPEGRKTSVQRVE